MCLSRVVFVCLCVCFSRFVCFVFASLVVVFPFVGPLRLVSCRVPVVPFRLRFCFVLFRFVSFVGSFVVFVVWFRFVSIVAVFFRSFRLSKFRL